MPLSGRAAIVADCSVPASFPTPDGYVHPEVLVLSFSSALAASLEIARVDDVYHLRGTFVDGHRRSHDLEVDLAAGPIDAADALRWEPAAVREKLAPELTTWAHQKGWPEATVRVEGDRLRWTAASSARTAAISTEYKRRWAEARAAVHLIDVDGHTWFDHAWASRAATDAVRPIADAIETALDERDYTDEALAFVQAIPYVKNPKDEAWPPLVVLATMRGDCDTKSALFIALLRARYPDVDAVILHTTGEPRHAAVGLAVDAHLDDTTFDWGGRTWVVAEPVGPAVHLTGQASPTTVAALEAGSWAVQPMTVQR